MAERTVASFRFDRRKTWPFMLMLLAMIGLGLAGVWTQGLAEGWGVAIVLVALPAAAFLMIARELRLEAPIIVVSEEGLLDRRRGPDVLPWSAIQEATVKRRSFNKGVRIVLTNGDRHDIELGLIDAEPTELMRHIQEQAARHGGAEAA